MDTNTITITVTHFSQALPELRARVEVGTHSAHISNRTGYTPDLLLDSLAIAAAKKIAAQLQEKTGGSHGNERGST